MLTSQLEETGAEYQVSMVVALSSGANAASQTRRVAQNRYGSFATVWRCRCHFRFSADNGVKRTLQHVRKVPHPDIPVGAVPSVHLSRATLLASAKASRMLGFTPE